MTITAAEYQELTGFEPIQDDLERTNCSRVGMIGHWFCGVCPDHNKPRFVCGCEATKEKQDATNKSHR